MSRCSAFVRHLLTLVLTLARCILSRKGQQSDEPCIQLTYGGLLKDQTACLGLFFSVRRGVINFVEMTLVISSLEPTKSCG